MAMQSSDELAVDTTTAGPLIVLGLVWTDEAPFLRIRRPAMPSQLVPLNGLDLSYSVTTVRHCLGFVARSSSEDRADCDNRPQPGEPRCVGCSVAQANFAAGLHHAHTRDVAELDSDALNHLRQPNSLYLAAFRDGSLKVGTSTSHRHNKRLLEQGAWRAVTAATTEDGIAVRNLEDAVTTALELPQSVSIKRKIRGMVSPLTDTDLSARLINALGEVNTLARQGDFGSPVTPTDPEEVDAWEFPQELWGEQKLHVYTAPLDVDCHNISVEATCGRMVMLSKPGSADRFVADVGQLFGREVDIGERAPVDITVQDSLF